MNFIARRRLVILFVAAVFLVVPMHLAAQTYEVAFEHNVAVKMRDGVTLRADIYRPKADGKFPVLLQRTPYDKTGSSGFGWRGATRGYVVIVQDVRGRYASEGDFYTFRNEPNDGYDTVEWAAALPYSDGRVGMFGGSYVGATQYLAAIAQPPHLAGIAPHVTASNYHDGWTYQSGAFEQWFNESWTSHDLSPNTFMRAAQAKSNALDWKNVLPLTTYPVLDATDPKSVAPYFYDWLAHPNYDDYWKQISIEAHYSQIQVPVFTIGAWYDIFQGGSLRNYELLKTQAGSDAAKHGQKLLMEIGGHAGGGRHIGDVDFGPDAIYDLDAQILDWYDVIFKGKAPAEDAKPVRIFVMGKNVWRNEDDWPLARAHSTQYFLHSHGSANSASGDGSLDTTAPTTETKDSFVYDPSNPVPTTGGPLCCDAPHLAPGPKDQRAVEDRKDVLIYSTPPFTQDTEVTGPVTLDLYASTSAVDTDFTAKLVDVWPNGFAQNLTEGILRLRYRNSQETPELAKPGEIYHLKIDVWSTSDVFLAGHRLRLEISSSNFPRFDRNLNTGEDQATASRMLSATNTIYHDRQHASALILPIVSQ